jgi:hypothetical protein
MTNEDFTAGYVPSRFGGWQVQVREGSQTSPDRLKLGRLHRAGRFIGWQVYRLFNRQLPETAEDCACNVRVGSRVHDDAASPNVLGLTTRPGLLPRAACLPRTLFGGCHLTELPIYKAAPLPTGRS